MKQLLIPSLALILAMVLASFAVIPKQSKFAPFYFFEITDDGNEYKYPDQWISIHDSQSQICDGFTGSYCVAKLYPVHLSYRINSTGGWEVKPAYPFILGIMQIERYQTWE